MYRLVETIKILDGSVQNSSFHNERMNRSRFDLFGIKEELRLEEIITIPDSATGGIFKCRIEYGMQTGKPEFIKYSVRPVASLKLVEDNSIEYSYKFTDRSCFSRLLEKAGGCDEIIIVKNGMITDASYANLVFRDRAGRWITPASYLLPGTRRASLISSGTVKEEIVRVTDLKNYTEARLINAMIGIDDSEGIPTEKIFF
jgi:4-amino-4-deoxychorismate lyase